MEVSRYDARWRSLGGASPKLNVEALPWCEWSAVDKNLECRAAIL
jgi:hypothetical protein